MVNWSHCAVQAVILHNADTSTDAVHRGLRVTSKKGAVWADCSKYLATMDN